MSERNVLIKLNWGKFAVGWGGGGASCTIPSRRDCSFQVTVRFRFEILSFLSSVLLGRRVVLRRHLISPR